MERVDETAVAVNQRRSERVIMQAAVILTAHTEFGEVVQDEAHTRVVSAHGGLLTSRVDLEVNQTLMMTNPKIGMSKRCRVVRCTKATSHEYSVAFEFLEPGWEFWPGVSLGEK